LTFQTSRVKLGRMNPVRDKSSSVPGSRCKRSVSNGMKTYNCIVIFILPMVLFISSCKKTDNSSLSLIVKQEIDRYPAQRLVDIYKTFFQGYLGPAHLITDSNSAAKYIEAELAQAEIFEDYDYQPLPPDGKLVRANLKLIKDGKISLEDFTAAFAKSAKPVSGIDIENWKAQWPKILAEIERQKSNMPNFQEDRDFIESLLEKNEYVIHHSDEFIEKYNPHYRVMSAEQAKFLSR